MNCEQVHTDFILKNEKKIYPPFFYYSFLWIWICFLGFLSTIKAVEFGSICFSGFSLYFWQCFVFVNSGILGVFLGFRKSLWVPKGRPHEAQFGQIQKPDPQYFFYFFLLNNPQYNSPRTKTRDVLSSQIKLKQIVVLNLIVLTKGNIEFNYSQKR